MNVTADPVRRTLEQMVPELTDYERRRIFTHAEVRSIVKTRTEFEHRAARRIPVLDDFVRALEYELNLDLLRRQRKLRLGKMLETNTVSDYAIVRRIHNIFERAVRRFPQDVNLWVQYLEWSAATGAFKRLARLFPRALQLHPLVPDLWLRAARHEADVTRNTAAARVYFQRGLRLNPGASALWLGFFEMEMRFLGRVAQRKALLGLLPHDTASPSSPSSSSSYPPLEPSDRALLSGVLPLAVFRNAIKSKALRDSYSFRLAFLPLIRAWRIDKPFSSSSSFAADAAGAVRVTAADLRAVGADVTQLHRAIVGSLRADFAQVPECWVAHARLALDEDAGVPDQEEEQEEEREDGEDTAAHENDTASTPNPTTCDAALAPAFATPLSRLVPPGPDSRALGRLERALTALPSPAMRLHAVLFLRDRLADYSSAHAAVHSSSPSSSSSSTSSSTSATAAADASNGLAERERTLAARRAAVAGTLPGLAQALLVLCERSVAAGAMLPQTFAVWIQYLLRSGQRLSPGFAASLAAHAAVTPLDHAVAAAVAALTTPAGGNGAETGSTGSTAKAAGFSLRLLSSAPAAAIGAWAPLALLDVAGAARDLWLLLIHVLRVTAADALLAATFPAESAESATESAAAEAVWRRIVALHDLALAHVPPVFAESIWDFRIAHETDRYLSSTSSPAFASSSSTSSSSSSSSFSSSSEAFAPVHAAYAAAFAFYSRVRPTNEIPLAGVPQSAAPRLSHLLHAEELGLAERREAAAAATEKLKLQYLAWALARTAAAGAVAAESAALLRGVVDSVLANPPFSLAVFTRAIEAEAELYRLSQSATATTTTASSAGDKTRLHSTFERAVKHFGADSTDLWVAYLRVLLRLPAPTHSATHSAAASVAVGPDLVALRALHWRALKELPSHLHSEFLQRYGEETQVLAPGLVLDS